MVEGEKSLYSHRKAITVFLDNCHDVSQNVTSECRCVMCDGHGQLPRTETRSAIAMVVRTGEWRPGIDARIGKRERRLGPADSGSPLPRCDWG